MCGFVYPQGRVTVVATRLFCYGMPSQVLGYAHSIFLFAYKLSSGDL